MRTMDTETAHILNSINKEFYAKNASSFSQTRSQGWQGWERLIEICGIPKSVLDIACGNMRFKSFLQQIAPKDEFAYYGIDTCNELVTRAESLHYQNLDMVSAALEGKDIEVLVEAPSCELVVAFGFMHHVPTMKARRRIMNLIAGKTADGGAACISFWRFNEEPTLAAKAQKVTQDALRRLGVSLDEGDYFLDWQGDGSSLRYCHSFTDGEISELAESVSHTCKAEHHYVCDGRNNALNSYIVLRKH